MGNECGNCCSGTNSNLLNELQVSNYDPKIEGNPNLIIGVNTLSTVILGYKEGHLVVVQSSTGKVTNNMRKFMDGEITHMKSYQN